MRRQRLPNLHAFDFRTASRSGNAFTLPAWLAIACATTGRTVQTGPSTIATGIGANVARARSVDGLVWDMLLGSARTDLTTWSNDTTNAAWLKGTGVTAAAGTAGGDPNGPDGTKSSTKVVYNGTGFASSFRWGQVIAAGYTNAAPYTGSVWFNAPTGENRLSITLNQSAGKGPTLSIPSTWTRYDFTDLGSGAQAQFTTYSDFEGIVNAGFTAYVYGAQVEAGRYPGPLIPTVGATASVAADVLSMPSPGSIVASGFPEISAAIRPLFASGEAGSDLDLLNWGGMRVYLSASSKRIILHTGGTDVQSSVLTWSRNQTINVRAMHSRGGRFLAVTGATTGNGEVTGGADTSIATPATAYLIGNSSGAQECCGLGWVEMRDAG